MTQIERQQLMLAYLQLVLAARQLSTIPASKGLKHNQEVWVYRLNEIIEEIASHLEGKF